MVEYEFQFGGIIETWQAHANWPLKRVVTYRGKVVKAIHVDFQCYALRLANGRTALVDGSEPLFVKEMAE